MELRERVARVIDPEAFGTMDKRSIYQMGVLADSPYIVTRVLEAERTADRLIEAGLIKGDGPIKEPNND